MEQERELWVTPEVETYLQTSSSEAEPVAFASEVVKQVLGAKGERGVTRPVHRTFLAIVVSDDEGSGADRVIVWHGPTDGIFFKRAILMRVKKLGFSVC